MTRYFLDSREISPPVEALELDGVLKYVEDNYLSPDCAVRQVHLDGLPVVVSQSPGPVSGRQRVEIFTGTMGGIALESIAEAIAYLDRIERLTPDLATNFQISPGSDSFEKLRQLYEGFYWLNLLLDRLESKFHIGLVSMVAAGKPAGAHLEKFAAILKDLIQAQQKEQFVLIADLLQYEVLPLVPVYRELFGLVALKIGVEPVK